MPQLTNLNPEFHINPTAAQAQAFMAVDPARPIMYLNLLRYHERAQYPADYNNPQLPTNVSGREAFHRYLRSFEADFLPQVGGRLLVVAAVELVVIGNAGWHEAMLGFYPTHAAGIQATGLPGYEVIGVHRLAGLADGLTLMLGSEAFARMPLNV